MPKNKKQEPYTYTIISPKGDGKKLTATEALNEVVKVAIQNRDNKARKSNGK